MPIRHVVLRQLKDGVTAEQIADMENRTRGLAAIPGVRSVVTGSNLDLVPRSDGFESVTIIDMDSAEVLPEFIAHRIHQESAALSSQLVERSIIVDLDLS